MNEDIRMALVKSIVFAQSLQEHDADYDLEEGRERRPAIAKMLVKAGCNALVIQLVAILDEAIELYVDAKYPTNKCRKLVDRIGFLAKRNELRFPDRVITLNERRNELAHEKDKYATWDDWSRAFMVVRVELEHLNIIPKPDYFSEPEEPEGDED